MLVSEEPYHLGAQKMSFAGFAGAKQLPVLSYHAVSLWQDDLLCLQEGSWLNDNVITFWFEFYSHQLFQSRNDYVFMHPSAAFMARHLGTDDLQESLQDLKLGDASIVFIPINDNIDATTVAGGSHWSMLIWYKREARFRHYDTSRNHNRPCAEAIALSVWPLLSPPVRELLLNGTQSEKKRLVLPIKHEATPQQTNGYDCGVYAMAIAAAVANAGGPADVSIVTPATVTAWRTRMRVIANELVGMQKVEQATRNLMHGEGKGRKSDWT